MPRPLQENVHNRILAALPAIEFALLAENLTHVELAPGGDLHRAGDAIAQIYFIEIGLISALATLSDGRPLEVGLIGFEGVVGVSMVLGATYSHNDMVCQAGGAAYQISAAALRDTVTHAPRLNNLLLRYAHAFHVQIAQTAACNARHELGPRLARWLLSAHDRSAEAELPLTQDWIAMMLGVRRSTVSIAASMLQRAGWIRYQHGRITILDRVGLEGAACECYEAVAAEYRALFDEYPTARPRT